jgi:hypothetical protein
MTFARWVCPKLDFKKKRDRETKRKRGETQRK